MGINNISHYYTCCTLRERSGNLMPSFPAYVCIMSVPTSALCRCHASAQRQNARVAATPERNIIEKEDADEMVVHLLMKAAAP